MERGDASTDPALRRSLRFQTVRENKTRGNGRDAASLVILARTSPLPDQPAGLSGFARRFLRGLMRRFGRQGESGLRLGRIGRGSRFRGLGFGGLGFAVNAALGSTLAAAFVSAFAAILGSTLAATFAGALGSALRGGLGRGLGVGLRDLLRLGLRGRRALLQAALDRAPQFFRLQRRDAIRIELRDAETQPGRFLIIDAGENERGKKAANRLQRLGAEFDAGGLLGRRALIEQKA